MLLVYVKNKNGKPLMPTRRYGKVRRMLRSGQAVVIDRCPFTIQLTYDTTDYVQSVSLGVDTGSVHVALSATTKTDELCSIECQLRKDITKLLSDRASARKTRRCRLRHRKPRFNNRKSSKKPGWYAPSIIHRIESHKKLIKLVSNILPISKITIEIGDFDAQKINNPEITNEEYQNGPQKGFWNVREYVLCRDKHTCQCCKGKSKDKILEVHHIESRKTGGDAPNNLITLCNTCHNKFHNGELPNFKPKRGKSLRDTAVMNAIKARLYNEVIEMFPNIPVRYTYGYITKSTRISNKIEEKNHRVDARCISGNPLVSKSENCYMFYQVRTRNRHIYKDKTKKGGLRALNQSAYKIKGYRLFDKIKYNNQTCFITGKRKDSGFFIRNVEYKVIHTNVSTKYFKFIDERKPFLIDIVKQ